MNADAMRRRIARLNIRQLKLSAVKCHNVTRDSSLIASTRDPHALITDPTNGSDIKVGDVIRTPNGQMMITAPGEDSEKPGLVVFPAAKIVDFFGHLRFSQAPADSTGRPDPEPELIRENLPMAMDGSQLVSVRVHDVRPGDVLQVRNEKFVVRGIGYMTGHAVELNTTKQT